MSKVRQVHPPQTDRKKEQTSVCTCAMNDGRRQKFLEAKRKADTIRSKTRVNLGVAFPRWRELKDRLKMKSDAELGIFLLDK